MGESHRGVSSLRRKLIEEPLKLRKKKCRFFVWFVHVYMLPPVTGRQHLQTLFVGVVLVERKRCLGVCADVNAGCTFCSFCFPASSSVSARSRHVRSFVAGAINSLQCAAPVVLPFADTPGASLVYMPTLHVVEKYWHCQSAAHCSWT